MLLPDQKDLSEDGARLRSTQGMSMVGRGSSNDYLRRSLVEGKYLGVP